jgi:hypothetical protein
VTSPTNLIIVVPTRNRPDMAEKTLRSIADQAQAVPTAVLVSDNSTTEAHRIALESVVGEIARQEGAVRYLLVRPPSDLAMGPHWEWARQQAAELAPATHVLYLTDRTLLKQGALAALGRVLDAFPDHVVSFNNDTVDDQDAPPKLRAENWSGEVQRLPSRRLLNLAREMIIPRPMPRALNSVMPVAVLARIEAAAGDVFNSTAPDFCFAYRSLQVVDEIVYVDRSLTVMHGLTRSNGMSTVTGVMSSDTRDFLGKAAAGIAHSAPLPSVITNYNVVASEYCAHDLGGRAAINGKAYLNALARETEAFVPGEMRDHNMAQLEAAGLRFTPAARWRRRLGHAVHYLRVLGPIDFVVLSVDRLRTKPPAEWPDGPAALVAGRRDTGTRVGRRALRYLRGHRTGVTLG